MNKKLKKMIVTISAVAMSTVSLSSIPSYAVNTYTFNISDDIIHYIEDDKYISCEIPLDTISFTVGSEKYTLWPEAMDYFYDFYGKNIKIYRSESNKAGYKSLYVQICMVGTAEDGKIYNMWSLSRASSPSYAHLVDKESQDIVVNFLSENNINYKLVDVMLDIPVLTLPDIETLDDSLSLATIITENTGVRAGMTIYEGAVIVDKVEVPLPEPTLSGDANKDGEVKLSDAVLVMQALSNPNEYQLTLQGIANADMDGDGITPMDALRIQEIALGK